jgi:hypothetical protein
MEELKTAIEKHTKDLPALSAFWEMQLLGGSSITLISFHYNTSQFRTYFTYKVLSTSINLTVLFQK